jgi:hypothetical protein
VTRARTLWDEGTEPGRQVVLLGVALTLTAIAVDLVIIDGLGWIFDIGFAIACPFLALRVRPQDFFTVGVLPPLLLFGVFISVGVIEPDTIATHGDSPFQAALTGMASHSGSLLVGYALCLACLAIRTKRLQRGLAVPRQSPGQSRGQSPGQSSKRSGSPAPRRTTTGVPSE